jgi:hypothetical protein
MWGHSSPNGDCPIQTDSTDLHAFPLTVDSPSLPKMLPLFTTSSSFPSVRTSPEFSLRFSFRVVGVPGALRGDPSCEHGISALAVELPTAMPTPSAVPTASARADCFRVLGECVGWRSPGPVSPNSPVLGLDDMGQCALVRFCSVPGQCIALRKGFSDCVRRRGRWLRS